MGTRHKDRPVSARVRLGVLSVSDAAGDDPSAFERADYPKTLRS